MTSMIHAPVNRCKLKQALFFLVINTKMCTSFGKLFAARSRNKSGVWQLNGKFMEGATRPRQLKPLWYNVELEQEGKEMEYVC